MRSGADPADTLRLAQNRALAQRIARVSRTRRKAMKREDVQAWIDAYVEAWRTYDPTEIAALLPRTPPTHITPGTRAKPYSGAETLSLPTGSRSRTRPARGRRTSSR